MQFLLPGQKACLSSWKSRPIHPLAARDKVPEPYYDHLDVRLADEPPGEPLPDGPFERVEQSLFAYRVFGPRLGLPVVERTPLELNDTIGLRYRFLGEALTVFFASRVVEVFHREPYEEGWRSGFSYRTLQGHPELGEELFEVRKDSFGTVWFGLRAWSRPNLWYVKLFTPWVRSIQKAAGRSASAHLQRVANSR